VLLLGAVASIVWAQTGRPPWKAGVYLFSDAIKVVLGAPRKFGEAEIVKYTAHRAALLRQVSQKSPDREMEAVLVFNAFLGPDETAALVEKHHLKAEEIYLAVPGLQGGGGARVITSIQDAYHGYVEFIRSHVEEDIEEVESRGVDLSIFRKRAQAVIDGKAGIFAVRVRGRLSDLAESFEEPVRLVDVFFEPEIEAATKGKGKPLRYIVSPMRPDGLP